MKRMRNSILAGSVIISLALMSGSISLAADLSGSPAAEAPLDADATLSVYPDAETLLDTYNRARTSGILDNAIYVESPTLSTLRQAYGYILDKERAAADLALPQAPVGTNPLGLSVAKADSACRQATKNCIVESVKLGYEGLDVITRARLFVCAIQAAGRDQQEPKVDSSCSTILEGGDICARANDVCGIVSTPQVQVGQGFAGSRGSHSPFTMTCGTAGAPNDRAIEMGVRVKDINGGRRIIGVWMRCSSQARAYVGGATPTAGSAFNRQHCQTNNTNPTTAIEGIRILNSSGRLNNAAIRCDDVLSASTVRDYFPAPMFNASYTDSTDLQCAEGKFIWGVNAYVNKSAPAADQYIQGLNLICR